MIARGRAASPASRLKPKERFGRVRKARGDLLDVAALVCIDNHETENVHLLRLALDLLCRHFRLQSRG